MIAHSPSPWRPRAPHPIAWCRWGSQRRFCGYWLCRSTRKRLRSPSVVVRHLSAACSTCRRASPQPHQGQVLWAPCSSPLETQGLQSYPPGPGASPVALPPRPTAIPSWPTGLLTLRVLQRPTPHSVSGTCHLNLIKNSPCSATPVLLVPVPPACRALVPQQGHTHPTAPGLWCHHLLGPLQLVGELGPGGRPSH